MSNPTRDEIKQAAERIIRWAEEKMTIEWDGLIVARAYLALREQVETVALPALKLMRDLHKQACEDVDAAIKAIEEGQG